MSHASLDSVLAIVSCILAQDNVRGGGASLKTVLRIAVLLP